MKARSNGAGRSRAAGSEHSIVWARKHRTARRRSVPPKDEIDHQLAQLGMRSAVDDELAQLKAELASSDRPTGTATRQENNQTVSATPTTDSAAEH
jgi:hypothetical protein